MRKLLFITLMLLFASVFYGQDVITKNNGQQIEVRIIGESESNVTYYNFEDPERVEITMNKSLIKKIDYEYGRKEVIKDPTEDESYFVNDKKNNIMLNFTSIASNSTIVAFEHSLDQYSSFGGSIQVHGLGAGNTEIRDRSGFALEGNYKVKTSKIFKRGDYRPNHILHGSYLRPDIGFTTQKITREYDYNNDVDETKYTYVYGGFDLGKQWIYSNRLSLDIYGGLNFYGGDFEQKNANGEPNTGLKNSITNGNMVGANDIAFRYGLQIGFLF